MRKIKFRCWNKNTNSFSDGEFGMTSDMESEDEGSVLQQFTGLLDKNGKEVYENDLVRVYGKFNEFGVVEYTDDWGAFGVRTIPNGMEMGFGDFDACEIIGDIYQNKDLLSK